MGLAETRRAHSKIHTTKKQNILLHTYCTNGQKGVGFLVKKPVSNKITEFKPISDRIAVMKIKLDEIRVTNIIQTYAPTAAAEEKESDNFYETLIGTMQELRQEKNNSIIVMGDFNSQIGPGRPEEQPTVGKYGYGKRNSRGWKLVRFCQAEELIIANTTFKKRKGKLWTWIAPNLDFKSQIDFILINKNYKITDCSVANFDYHSDHRLLTCTLECKQKIKTHKMKSNTHIINRDNAVAYESQLDQLLQKIDKKTNIDATNLTDTIKKATELVRKNNKKPKQKTTIPKEIKDLITKREKLKRITKKSKKDKIDLNLTCKIIKKKLREHNLQRKNEIINEILKTTKSTKSIRKLFTVGKNWTTYLIDENGRKQYNRFKINEIATEFYTELYSDSNKSTDKTNNKINTNLLNKNADEPEFLKREVEYVIKNLKDNKATGHDKITNEQFKFGGNALTLKLTEIFNEILKTQLIPQDWKKSDIILVFKKGNKHDIANYRPITLATALSKILSKLIELRIRRILTEQQPREQAGFRKYYSTIDHIHTLNQLIEKTNEHQLHIHLAFIDYTKAFDSIKHNYLIEALRNQGVPETYTNIIKDMYRNVKSRIITDKIGNYFNIERGVKQGDPLSPLLFNCALEEIIKQTKWNEKGILINGERLNNLRFADDLVIISGNLTELEQMITELNDLGKEAGLNINMTKTKILTKDLNSEIKIDGKKIETVPEIIYLGQLITFNNRTENEINRRITLTWKKYWSLKHIFKGPFSDSHKSTIFNSCIVPTLSYGSQSWTITKKIEKRLQTTQNAIERSMLNYQKKRQNKNFNYKKQTKK